MLVLTEVDIIESVDSISRDERGFPLTHAIDSIVETRLYYLSQEKLVPYNAGQYGTPRLLWLAGFTRT